MKKINFEKVIAPNIKKTNLSTNRKPRGSVLCLLVFSLVTGCSNAWNKNPKVTGVLAGQKITSQAEGPADSSIQLRDDVANFKEGAEETTALRFATYQPDKIKDLDYELKTTGELKNIEHSLEKYGDGQYKIILKWAPPEFLVPRKQDTAEYIITLRLFMKTPSDNIIEREFPITIKVFKNILRPEVIGYVRYEDHYLINSKEVEDELLAKIVKTENKFLVPSSPVPEMSLPVEPEEVIEGEETEPTIPVPPLDESGLKTPEYQENETNKLYIIVNDPESKNEKSLRLPPLLNLVPSSVSYSYKDSFRYIDLGDDAGEPIRSPFNPSIWYIPVEIDLDGLNLTSKSDSAIFSVEARSQHDPKVLSRKLTVEYEILDKVKDPITEWALPIIFSTAQLNNYVFRVFNPDGEGTVEVYFATQCKDYGMRCLCDTGGSASKYCYVQWTPPLNSPSLDVVVMAASISERLVDPRYTILPEYVDEKGKKIETTPGELASLRSKQIELKGRIDITSDGKPVVVPPADPAKPASTAPRPTHKIARER